MASVISHPAAALGLGPDQAYPMHELLTDASYEWRGPRGFVELDPAREPAQIFHLRRR